MSGQRNDQLNSSTEIRILRTVKQTVAAYNMFQAGDAVLAAVSGGPDSVALIHILRTLCAEFSLRLAIAHLNHGLRQKESERDAEFVSCLARSLELPFYFERREVRRYRHRYNLSLEDAARRVRYSFLDRVAEANGFNKIALGHQFDDNAELVLMFLLRGSGPLGLAGMAPVREDRIVRPLLKIRRSAIMDYLAEKKLEYVCDTSNVDRNFRRNDLRYDLIPRLKSSYNPKIIEALNRLACISRSEEEWIETLLEPIFESVVLTRGTGQISLSRAQLERISIAARRRIIRKAILWVKGDLRRITFLHIDAIIRLAGEGPPHGSLDLPDRLKVRRNHQMLFISRETKKVRTKRAGLRRPQNPVFEYTIAKPGRVHLKEIGVYLRLTETGLADFGKFIRAGQKIAFFDINKLAFPLIVRNFRPGDRFSPLGMTGTQKLKKFFINNKIPRAERAVCPLLVSGAKIIWVAGYRIDDSVKVSPETQNVLKAELLLA
jgi:tRNA(Ile)-lysidine synthase